MDVFRATLLFVWAAVFFGESHGEPSYNDNFSNTSAVMLLLENDLFCSYNKNVRPVMKNSTQIVVNTTIYLYSFYLNEEKNTLIMWIDLEMNWNDEFLVWNISKYNNIINTLQDSTKIWMPNIVSYNKGFDDDLNPTSYALPPTTVQISNKGHIEYTNKMALTTHCPINVAKWPFDSQTCTFVFVNPLYSDEYVYYSFSQLYTHFYKFAPIGEWTADDLRYRYDNILDYETGTTKKAFIYDVLIKRNASLYYSSVIIPALVISLMVNFTFLMGRQTPLRISLLGLFFISEVLYIQFLDTKILGNGEHVVYIVVLYRNTLFITAIALVACVISNELYKHGTQDVPRECPEWLKSELTSALNVWPIDTLVNTRETIRLIDTDATEDTPNRRRDENALIWKTLSAVMDRLSLIVTLLATFVNCWYYLP